MIIIVDYGMGNLRSILYKLQKLQLDAAISSKTNDIESADRLILPGVGNFAEGMKNLEKDSLLTVLNKMVLEKKTPVLGICLGMQLFAKKSEEGNVEGLGWIDAEVKKFNFDGLNASLRIPHVGWNTINLKQEHSFLVDGTHEQRFYFTHSYHMCCYSQDDVVATTHYGYEFVSVVSKNNIFGSQFHPEKSHKSGFEVVRRFAERT
ncbi:imidazole glycerol phosphate synthase subunit HisH [Candidatus Omnitrophota bacterium]